MHFVGIFSDDDDYEFIKNELLKEKKCSNIELLNLNENNIENMRNIKFEIIVICTDMKKMHNQQSIINNLLKEADYLLINSDLDILIAKSKNSKMKIITYGMNQRATVTTSSVKEDDVLICLQRNIEDINGNIIEIQEFKITEENINNKNIYNLLVLFIIKLLYR